MTMCEIWKYPRNNWTAHKIDIVPTSIIKAMANGDLLQIVVFSVFFALAICAVGEKAKPVLDCVSSLSEIMFKFTHFVIT